MNLCSKVELAMRVVRLNIILLTWAYFATVFGFFGFQTEYHRLRLKNRNFTTPRMLVREKRINQLFDNYNKSSGTWQMRYFEGLEFWKKGGPVYLYINGESEADKIFIQTGIIYELAQETNGALYLSEHRYYGKSKPYTKLNTKNLAYLSSQQALADIANLLTQIKSLSKYEYSKVVVVGGSYPGSLATWMRLFYSDLVDAAIASSAPVLAKANFYAYLEVVGDDYKQFGTTGCYEKIVKKFKRYEQLLGTRAGIQTLKKEENICNSTDLTNADNIAVFFLYKESHYSGLVQYGNAQKIKDDCNKMRSRYSHRWPKGSSNDLLKLSDRAFWKQESSCHEYTFDSFVESIKYYGDSMAWTYQTCTEFGFYQVTSSGNQPFTDNIPIELYYKMCSKLYGAEFDGTRVEEGISNTNAIYGGNQPDVTQVVFVNGDIDPWYPMGVLQNLSRDAPAFLVHGSSHIQDLDSDAPGDPKMLKDTRKKVKRLIKKWIGEDDKH